MPRPTRPTVTDSLEEVRREVVACTRCPRLVRYRTAVARERKREFRDEEYWGRGVPGFGDPAARLVVVGLAPAAHGSNRTGRVFTGDRSAAFLVRAFHAVGYANQPTSVQRGDGLRYHDLYLTAAVRCAPPGNRPAPAEQASCAPYLEREFQLLPNTRAVPGPRWVRMGSGPRTGAAGVRGGHPLGPVRPRGVRTAGRRATAPVGVVPPEPPEHQHGKVDVSDAHRSPPSNPRLVRVRRSALQHALPGERLVTDFEVLERDGLGRIGRLATPHGPIETPALLPVVHPDPGPAARASRGVPPPTWVGSAHHVVLHHLANASPARGRGASGNPRPGGIHRARHDRLRRLPAARLRLGRGRPGGDPPFSAVDRLRHRHHPRRLHGAGNPVRRGEGRSGDHPGAGTGRPGRSLGPAGRPRAGRAACRPPGRLRPGSEPARGRPRRRRGGPAPGAVPASSSSSVSWSPRGPSSPRRPRCICSGPVTP